MLHFYHTPIAKNRRYQFNAQSPNNSLFGIRIQFFNSIHDYRPSSQVLPSLKHNYFTLVEISNQKIGSIYFDPP